MTPGPLLSFAAIALVAALVFGPRRPRLWLALLLPATAAAAAASILVLCGAPEWEWRNGFSLGGEALHLRLDAVSAVFLVLLSLVGAAGAIYSREYWSDHHQPESAPRGRLWWSALVLSMGLVLLASNGLYFLLGWEAFTVSAFFLITLERDKSEARAAGWLYLAASHVGTLCLFAFFASLANHFGNWDLGPMRDQPVLAPLFWLALAGFSVKAGVFPVHIWLPSGHANAPSHVSAILSGVAIKMGIYGMVRFSGWLPLPHSAGPVVIGLGAVSALLGAAFALSQNDFKRLLAYCSVENIGIILIGLGGAITCAAQGGGHGWGLLLLAGALLHVWSHGLFKSLLFLGAGSVLHATGTREMSRLGGLWKRMPWTAGLFAFGAIAISGLPPLNGFVSEWMVYLGLFDAVTGRTGAGWIATPAVLALGITGALALATFVKAVSVTFLGAPRTKIAEEAHECGRLMIGPMLTLAFLCAAIALAPAILWPALARASAAWNPAWQGAASAAPLTTMGTANLVLAAVMLAGAVYIRRRSLSNGLRRGLTWDCGYARPIARMQYTGGSFSGIAAGWFAWFFRPEQALKRPRGPFPGQARHSARVPETVLEKVIRPAGNAVMAASTAVRRLQHGRLQSYIVYLLGGLAAIALLVLIQASQ